MRQSYDKVTAPLAARGHSAEATEVIAAAQREPGRLACTRNGCSWAVAWVDGSYLTSSNHPGQYPHQPQHEAEAG
jgi:hypothetical protein